MRPSTMDRNEQPGFSRRYSRFGGRSRDRDAIRRARRITLIDILLLALAVGVLVPFVLRSAAAEDSETPQAHSRVLGAVQVQTAEARRAGSLVITANFSLVDNASPVDTDSGIDVGIVIYSREDKPVDSAFDLAPAASSPRQLIVSAPENTAAYYTVSSGDKRMRIELTVEDG